MWGIEGNQLPSRQVSWKVYLQRVAWATHVMHVSWGGIISDILSIHVPGGGYYIWYNNNNRRLVTLAEHTWYSIFYLYAPIIPWTRPDLHHNLPQVSPKTLECNPSQALGGNTGILQLSLTHRLIQRHSGIQ